MKISHEDRLSGGPHDRSPHAEMNFFENVVTSGIDRFPRQNPFPEQATEFSNPRYQNQPFFSSIMHNTETEFPSVRT